MVQVILAAGDYVAEDVWFRIIQVVTNNSDIQEYACEKLLSSVKSKYAHETAVCLGKCILYILYIRCVCGVYYLYCALYIL